MTNVLLELLFEGEKYDVFNLEEARKIRKYEDDVHPDAIRKDMYGLLVQTDLSEYPGFIEAHADVLNLETLLQVTELTDYISNIKPISNMLVTSIGNAVLGGNADVEGVFDYLNSTLSKERLTELLGEALEYEGAVLKEKLASTEEAENEEEYDNIIEDYRTSMTNVHRLNSILAINYPHVMSEWVEDYYNLFNLPLLAVKEVGITLEAVKDVPYVQSVYHEDTEYAKLSVTYAESQGVISPKQSLKQLIEITYIEDAMIAMNRAALQTLLNQEEQSEQDTMKEPDEVVQVITPGNK